MKAATLTILALVASLNGMGQIELDSSQAGYSLKINNKTLHFQKALASNAYSSVHYSFPLTKHRDNELKSELDTIKLLWEAAEDKIIFDLKSINLNYPLAFVDTRKKHIQAFKQSKEWATYVRKNGRKLNYALIHQVMLKEKVYSPLDEFLAAKGYRIRGYSTEKHGFLTKKELQTYGFTGNETIPMPYLVNILIEKIP